MKWKWFEKFDWIGDFKNRSDDLCDGKCPNRARFAFATTSNDQTWATVHWLYEPAETRFFQQIYKKGTENNLSIFFELILRIVISSVWSRKFSRNANAGTVFSGLFWCSEYLFMKTAWKPYIKDLHTCQKMPTTSS